MLTKTRGKRVVVRV
jgi:hypothetical protein